MAEVREYLAGDRIQCLVCGEEFKRLQFKHLALHEMTADDYRETFGIPWKYSLTSAPSRKATGDAMTPERIEAFRRAKPGRNDNRRPLAPAVRNQWQENAESGRYIAREPVTVGCAKCGAAVETTALCATQPIHCEGCASPAALRLRRKWRAEKGE
jgi:DNA-directed RNA polymerase subunit RPC12/RpoP